MMIILQGIKIEKITVWIILSCNHLDRNQRIFHHAHDESRRLYRKGRIELIEKPIPSHGPNDALLKITTTTICGTDIHILKGEYAVPHGLTVGHEPVGIIENSGAILKALKKGSERWPAPFAPRLRPMPARWFSRSGRCLFAGMPLPRIQSDGGVAFWQCYRWHAG